MNVSEDSQQITVQKLITYAKTTFEQYGCLWAASLAQFLERHCEGLGGVWARQSVGHLLAPDSAWQRYILQLESYLEDDPSPETLHEIGRQIWYQAGLHNSEQKAVAWLYWAAAFQRRGAADVYWHSATATEIIVGEFPGGADRFTVALNQFERLAHTAAPGGSARALLDTL